MLINNNNDNHKIIIEKYLNYFLSQHRITKDSLLTLQSTNQEDEKIYNLYR